MKAFVVREQGSRLTEKDIKRECQSLLDSFMVPKLVFFVDDPPKTTTGKIRKTGLS